MLDCVISCFTKTENEKNAANYKKDTSSTDKACIWMQPIFTITNSVGMIIPASQKMTLEDSENKPAQKLIGSRIRNFMQRLNIKFAACF